MQKTIYYYEFSRRNIVTYDVRAELSRLSPWTSSRTEFTNKIHRVIFTVNGYDDDPRPLSRIPEVYHFMKAINKQWPFLFNFAYPDPVNFDWLLNILYLEPIDWPDPTISAGYLNSTILKAFYLDWLKHAHLMAEHLNVPSSIYQERQKEMLTAVQQYLISHLL